jgi:O-antigen/teichoic acid export membrane protein
MNHTPLTRLLKTGATLFLIKAGGITLALGLAIVLARGLGAQEYGIYSYALSIATLLAVPVQLGLPTLVVRDTARLKQAGEIRQMYRLWSWSTLAVLIVSALLAIPIWLLSPHIFNQNLTVLPLLIVLALVPMMSFSALRAAALRGLGHVVQGQLPEMLLRPALILALILIVQAFGPILEFGKDGWRMQAQHALLMNLVATALAFVAGLILLRRIAPTSNFGSEARSLHREWIRAGMVLGIASSAMMVNRNLDMVMLGSLRPAEEVGVYKIAVTLATLSSIALNLLNLVVQPRIAQMFAASDINGIRRLVTMVSRVGFATGCVVAMIFYGFGERLIVAAFGGDYSEAQTTLKILVLGQLANTFFGPVIMVLNMTGHERIVMWSVIACALGNIALNALLIPIYGATGAAIATATTLFAWNLILHSQSVRKLGIDPSILGTQRGISAL